MWVSADTPAQKAQASSGAPNAAACRVSVLEPTTTQSASRSTGTIEAASSISARTGVVPGFPISSTVVISAPTQCERLISSGPETPGKKYLLPPEKPTTSCGNTGPTTIATSASATCRLTRTGVSGPLIRPPVSSASRVSPIVPSETKVSGSQDSWFTTRQPG